MCGNNPQLNAALITMGLNFLSEILTSELGTANTTDVLVTATNAYQQGKLTKTQYIAVINALDETQESVTRSAWVEQPIKGHAFLKQYQR